ncbi:hypothetical protein BN871_BC_00130 [Paenibacillus sp. P22]|nr:hypothetical protein BN871_BC_00130 [Paenibacillus sp. P22]
MSGNGIQRVLALVDDRLGLQQPLRIRMLRIVEQLHDFAFLDDLAGIHDHDVVGHLRDDAEIMRDEQDRHPAFILEAAQQVQNLSLDRDVESGRRLVGDEQLRIAGHRDRDHDALQHAAAQLMRIRVHDLLRPRDSDESNQVDRPRPRLLPAQLAMLHQRLDDLLADLEHRIQRRHRLLKDHGNVVAAHGPQLVRLHGKQIAAVELDGASDDFAGRAFHQPHDRHRRNAFAAAGFPDDAHRFAGPHMQAHSVDGPHRAGFRAEMRFQLLNMQQVFHDPHLPSLFRVQNVPQTVAENIDGDYRHEDGETRRNPQPRTLLEIDHVVGRVDHVAPGRSRRRDAEAEEAEYGLAENRAADIQRGDDDQQRHQIGKQMVEQLAAAAQAEHRRRLHELAFPEAENLAPDHAGQSRPADDRQHDHDDVHPVVGRNLPFREERACDEEQGKAGNGQQQIRHSHDDLIGYAAVIAGDDAEQAAQQDGQHHGCQSYRERDAARLEHAGQHIPAERIVAQPVLGAWGFVHQRHIDLVVRVRREQGAEEADRKHEDDDGKAEYGQLVLQQPAERIAPERGLRRRFRFRAGLARSGELAFC